ncbi:MAG TPA: 1-acyl-sn-glycerol-3-phosphate acyltransferase [Chthoniobacterales bacterium]|jgi:acyl-[acyl-carrier-protein]-phospholipid O-acyltransferase/long-chain-fatty-acid--[acyl-carrier-protein] ligase
MKTTEREHRSWLDRGIERGVRAMILPLGRIFYRVTVVGAEHLPATGGALFVCNHVSYADTIPLSLACNRHFRFTSFAGLFDQPILGRCLRAFGSIPVSPSSARETIRRASDCAAAGESVLLFPEGKLTLDGRLQEIKGGYELIARRANVPVVMVHLDGLWGSIFSFEGGRWFFKWPRPWRRNVTVTFAPPLAAEAATPERLEAFWKARSEAARREVCVAAAPMEVQS